MQNILIGLIILLLGGAGYYMVTSNMAKQTQDATNAKTEQVAQEAVDASTKLVPEVAKPVMRKEMEVIGKSIEGRDIMAYHFGTGAKELLVVGGIHGSYSANTAQVANETIEWLKANPSAIPANVSVTVIPSVNPDGAAKPGMRFNTNTVDLNRNFDCDWKAEGVWQNKKVSGGTAAFSEPESKSVQNYVETYKPTAAVVFYSAAGGVYASACGGEVSTATLSLLSTYAQASGYTAHDSFDAYTVTGDMVNWLAKLNIPAISVLLTNHTDTEWTKNEAGLKAVLQSLAK